MKQTVVIKVSIDDHNKYKYICCYMLDGHKVRSKALKIAAGFKGVVSASLKGDEKDQIEVKGEMIDTVKLTSILRKKVGPAHIITVAEEKKEEKKEDKKIESIAWPYGFGVPSYPYPICEVRDCQSSWPTCSIM